MAGARVRKPTFFWQGILILLPVAVLVTVGLWALRQDQASVEREAQSRTETVAAAVLAQIENSFQVLKFQGEERVTGMVVPPDILHFALRSNYELDQNFPLLWPPLPPPPLAVELAVLAPDKLEEWKTAEAAFANAQWSRAVEGYNTFLNGHTSFKDISSDDARAHLNNERIRAQGLFSRAVALERLGNIQGAVEAYDGLLDGHLDSGDPRTESGVSIYHLAILKILDLARNQVARLPDRWQKNPVLPLNWLEREGSPFGEEIIRRLRQTEPEPDATNPGVRPTALARASQLGSAERFQESWRLYNEVAGSRSPGAPWPEEFWVEGRYHWLAVEQHPPPAARDSFNRHEYAAFPESQLHTLLSSIERQADTTAECAVRVELHGRALVVGERARTDWKRRSISSATRSADGTLAVTATLADPPEFFFLQQRRQRLFSALLLAAAAACVGAYFLARHAFIRQLRLNEMKSNFVSSVSHELRAPIASMRLMAESLERGKIQDPPKQNEYFRFIVQECRRLSALVENILDFARIEQGRKQYEFEPVNLSAMTRETVRLMEPYAAEKGVALKLETSNAEQRTPNIEPAAAGHQRNGEFELTVDGRAIQQALVNLIDNAIKHSPKGETVAVGIEVSGAEEVSRARRQVSGEHAPQAASPDLTPPPRLMLSVADHGPGIPREEHEKIFERFYRRGSELRRETQGVGIGLSIVQHIVEAHGGRVRVQSEVGKGSRFTIELPMTK